MDPITFFVQGDPKGQPRARAFARKVGNTFIARVYDAGTAEGWKSQIAEAAKAHIPFPPLLGPLEVCIRLYFRRPKAHFTRKGLRPNAPLWHTSKPDRDNCEKAILDALKTIGMFKDDCQVCCGAIQKRYADIHPGAEISVRSAPELIEQINTAALLPGYPHHD